MFETALVHKSGEQLGTFGEVTSDKKDLKLLSGPLSYPLKRLPILFSFGRGASVETSRLLIPTHWSSMAAGEALDVI
jgi:hypothetical protein